MNPMAIATELVKLMEKDSNLADIEAAPPGFINFTLKNSWLTEQVDSVLTRGENYGNIDIGKGTRIQIEFVSANPTGPLHVGNGRGAILGSTLASVFAAAGYGVEQEYYVNDAGTQINTFCGPCMRYQQALSVMFDAFRRLPGQLPGGPGERGCFRKRRYFSENAGGRGNQRTGTAGAGKNAGLDPQRSGDDAGIF